jgi:hypothetical protein
MKTPILIICFALMSCSIVRSKPAPLTLDEVLVIQAAIKYDLDSSDVETRRPIVLLDRTEKWMPQEPTEKEINEYPEDVRKEMRDPNNLRNIPPGLRQNNKKQFSIASIVLQHPVVLYDASLFEKQYRNKSCCKALVKRFGKEPYVFSASRPYINRNGTAIVLLTDLATWSGCGGLDIYRVVKKDDTWVVQDWDLLIFW